MQAKETNEKEQMLGYMAKRAAGRSFYLANAFEEYRTAHQLDRPALADWLNITIEQLTHLELCQRPNPQAGEARYLKDIEAIATKFGVDPLRLKEILEN